MKVSEIETLIKEAQTRLEYLQKMRKKALEEQKSLDDFEK